jgi:GTPase SAR1 family protein
MYLFRIVDKVGKSTLISTFVSRYFSETGIPDCLTRVRLPPDPVTGCSTTLVDTISGSCSPSQRDGVDAIILLYDLNRWETLDRLETYWLPMIQEIYQEQVRGPWNEPEFPLPSLTSFCVVGSCYFGGKQT